MQLSIPRDILAEKRNYFFFSRGRVIFFPQNEKKTEIWYGQFIPSRSIVCTLADAHDSPNLYVYVS